MTTADSLIAVDGVGCALVASDPSVSVTRMEFSLITFPSVFANSVAGPAFGVLSGAPIDFEAPDITAVFESGFYAFAYAAAPVTVTAQGDDC